MTVPACSKGKLYFNQCTATLECQFADTGHDTPTHDVNTQLDGAFGVADNPGLKKSKNFHLSPGQVHQNFYLSCYQITCPCQGKIDYQ